MREQIAAVLAAHAGSSNLAASRTRAARASGATDDDLHRNADGYAADARVQAALRFAHAVLVTRGRLERADFAAARRGGLSERERAACVEIVVETLRDVITANVRAAEGG